MLENKPHQLILHFHTLESLRVRIGWIVSLRWVAVLGLVLAIPVAQEMFKFDLAFPQIYTITALMLFLNLIYFFLYKFFPFKDFAQELAFTEVQIIIDYVLLSFLVHYTGGIGNTFFFLYLVYIVISGILFQGRLPYINAFLAAFLQTLWSVLEYFNIVDVYQLSPSPVPAKLLVVSLCAFYVLLFTTTYVITDFINLYRRLKHIIDEKSSLLEKTISDRDRIFRFTAHELKSPLTTLRSMLAVIEEVYSAKLEPEVKDMVERAVRRTDQVLLMVKDMIDVTQYRQGISQKMIEQKDLADWVHMIVEQQRAYAEGKKIELVFDSNISEFEIPIDCTAMEKVLANLVNNAIRYTPREGKVIVRSFVRNDVYGFSVSDNGIGISQNELEKIFEEFFRGKNAREMENLGTGLGLCLVKQIVEQYGGQIIVTSELGKGSIFTVEFPLPVQNEDDYS